MVKCIENLGNSANYTRQMIIIEGASLSKL